MNLIVRVFHDFWPLDRSAISPNLIASGIAFFAGWMAKGRQIVHHIKALHAKHDELAARQQERHEAVVARQEEQDRKLERMARDHGHQLAQIQEAVLAPSPPPPAPVFTTPSEAA